jgi:hypothetical protein
MLFGIKVVLIPLTILYIILDIIFSLLYNIYPTLDEKSRKIFSTINQVLFYLVIAIVIFVSFVLLYVTRRSSTLILKDAMSKFKKKSNVSVEKDVIGIPQKYLNYYISVIWWMLLYFGVVTVIVTIAKITNDTDLIYFLF